MNKPTFINTDSIKEFDSWNGKAIEILGVIANPDDNSILDAEAMPQFSVKLLETGETNTAYVNEIAEEFWTDEMKAVLEGQNAFSSGKQDNPYTSRLGQFFEFGLKLGEIKGLQL